MTDVYAADCPDALLPDGPTCPRCGGPRAPSGVGGGSWVHFPRHPAKPERTPAAQPSPAAVIDVEAAVAAIAGAGICHPVCAENFDGKHLPDCHAGVVIRAVRALAPSAPARAESAPAGLDAVRDALVDMHTRVICAPQAGEPGKRYTRDITAAFDAVMGRHFLDRHRAAGAPAGEQGGEGR